MVRPKVTSAGAKRTTIYLNPQDDFLLSFIENSRRIRQEKRYQPSEIIADALRFYVEKAEGKNPEEIIAQLPKPTIGERSNVTIFPKKS
jgi:hypothetical protein